ncbi:uncharacterized protein Dwil_GK13719 [Drosophila willistoni]|uniref:Protein hugin n=1 Tax=Drosophila willistoni TaxID=7260 RepID=B4NHZ3_DROWI|nr:protein hugin [Drosophila willistoni]EDW83643.1 uncharacterized protein Dwil_GK13719 [Drosophila willistoni]
MCRPRLCTLVLIAASCYALAISGNAKAMQGTNKLDLPNRISGEGRGSSFGTPATGARAGAGAGALVPQSKETRQKRAMGEYKELVDIIDELEENSLAQKTQSVAVPPPQTQEFDLDTMPPLTYYLLLQKLRQLQSNGEPAYRVRTPRLGRSIDFQQLLGEGGGAGADEASGGQFMSRMIKKSVPFKPRLGKRALMCGED